EGGGSRRLGSRVLDKEGAARVVLAGPIALHDRVVESRLDAPGPHRVEHQRLQRGDEEALQAESARDVLAAQDAPAVVGVAAEPAEALGAEPVGRSASRQL